MSHFSAEQVNRLILAAYNGEDRTEYMHDDSTPSFRYIVTGHVQGTGASWELIRTYPRRFAAIVREWARAVGSNAETLGVWHDSGHVYIDAGDTVSHRAVALRRAERFGEQAIFDRVENRVIHVGE